MQISEYRKLYTHCRKNGKTLYLDLECTKNVYKTKQVVYIIQYNIHNYTIKTLISAILASAAILTTSLY